MSEGKFSWFEFYADEMDGAVAFYTEVAGWKTRSAPMPSGPYQMLQAGETPVAGLVPLPPEAAKAGVGPHWLGYISTHDVDETTERCRALGGSVVKEPFDVEAVGRIAILVDPQGAAFAVFAPEQSSPLPEQTADGVFGWSELATSNREAAVAFYRDLFGWRSTGSVEMESLGAYDMFGYPDEEGSRGGIFGKPPEMPVSAWIYYVNVDDLDAAVTRVERGGGGVLNGPNDVQGGRIAQCRDPRGGVFALHQYT